MNTATVKSLEEVMLEQHEQRLEQQRALALLPETAVQLHQNVEQMGALLMQMGQAISMMQKRMEALEARQAQVTISHAEAKRLQVLIRMRADQICGKYSLQDKDSPRIIRAAIKKDVLRRANVKDLHDIPEAKLEGTERQIDSWTSIKLVMERRAGA